MYADLRLEPQIKTILGDICVQTEKESTSIGSCREIVVLMKDLRSKVAIWSLYTLVRTGKDSRKALISRIRLKLRVEKGKISDLVQIRRIRSSIDGNRVVGKTDIWIISRN